MPGTVYRPILILAAVLALGLAGCASRDAYFGQISQSVGDAVRR